MTVNFWCGAVAFMAVYFGFVLFVLYDSTGSEPETVLESLARYWQLSCNKEGK